MKKMGLVLVLCLLPSLAVAQSFGVSVSTSGGVAAHHTAVGRAEYRNLSWDCVVLKFGLVAPSGQYAQTYAKLSISDMAFSCDRYNEGRASVEVGHTHLAPLFKDIRLALSAGIHAGYFRYRTGTLVFAGPSLQLGLDIGDENMRLRPFAYLEGGLGEGPNQTRAAFIGVGIGLEVTFFFGG